MADWQSRLAGVGDEQILVGLDALPKDWPPTVDEFRELCMGKADRWEHRTAAYQERPRTLALEKKADPVKARAELGMARRLLSGTMSAREKARYLSDAESQLGGSSDG